MHAQKCRYSRWPRSAGLTLSHACAEYGGDQLIFFSFYACAEVPPLKMAVTSPAVVAHEGSLYVTGGAILEDGDGIELVQR